MPNNPPAPDYDLSALVLTEQDFSGLLWEPDLSALADPHDLSGLLEDYDLSALLGPER